jgi:hypothetical protein
MGGKLDHIEDQGDSNEISTNEKVRSDKTLKNEKTNRDRQRYYPKGHSAKREKFLQGWDIELKRPRKASGYLETRQDQEKANASNTPNEDMSRKESDKGSNLAGPH